MSAGFADHFSDGSAGYAAHRPTYPPTLIDLLAGIAPACDLALDAACGTGQLSVGLAERFARVLATDASAAQIAAARPHPRIDYLVAPAERSGLPAGSVDLVTVAQAAHWLDLSAFYAEVRRVARPGAGVALIAYGTPRLEDPAADAVLRRFYHDTLARYWPAERGHVESGYADLLFPFAPLPAPPLSIERVWDADALVGYVATWSAVRAMAKAAGDPLPAFHDELAASLHARTRVVWPIALRLGRA